MSNHHKLFVICSFCFFVLVQVNASTATVSPDKQDKLIDILSNLQLSIKEILGTLGTTPAARSADSGKTNARFPISQSRETNDRKIHDSLNGDRGGGGGGSDRGSSGGGSSHETPSGHDSLGGGRSSSGVDALPGGGSHSSTTGSGARGSSGGSSSSPTSSSPSSPSPGSSSNIPKPVGPGKPFRCAATYAGSYGHEYEKPSLHHTSHYGVSNNHDFTPHMIEARWSLANGWEPAFIMPHQNITLYPSAKVLVHGQQVFDVLQAIMGFDNRIRLFRPNLHLERFRRSAARIGLPDLDSSELTICLKRLILTDASFLPPSYSNGSLEIRTMMIGVDDDMRIKPAEDVILYVFMNRHRTDTLSELSKPQSVFADSQYSRSWVGGIGEFKTSANYAGTLLVSQIAAQQGYTDVLWLNSKEELITSLNMANVFVFIINELGKRELITPPVNGLIVPGIIRQTVLEMTRHWNEFDVTERSISIHEIRTLRRQGRLLEMFSTNTMANAVPIISIYYAPIRSLVRVPTLDQRDPLYLRLNRAIHAIEYGLIVHPWGEIV